MIVDTSAVIALVLGEPNQDALLEAMSTAKSLRMSTATWGELGVVADRRLTPAARATLEQLVDDLGIEVVDLTLAQAKLAREAHRRYGPGSGSKARLNLGDCFSYALAKRLGEPLLFTGEDFTHTDARLAPLPSSSLVE